VASKKITQYNKENMLTEGKKMAVVVVVVLVVIVVVVGP